MHTELYHTRYINQFCVTNDIEIERTMVVLEPIVGEVRLTWPGRFGEYILTGSLVMALSQTPPPDCPADERPLDPVSLAFRCPCRGLAPRGCGDGARAYTRRFRGYLHRGDLALPAETVKRKAPSPAVDALAVKDIT